MRYSYEFKIECTKLYRQGKWAETPKGIKGSNFRKLIRCWAQIEDIHGAEALRHKNANKIWTVEEKFELVSQVKAGWSIASVVFHRIVTAHLNLKL